MKPLSLLSSICMVLLLSAETSAQNSSEVAAVAEETATAEPEATTEEKEKEPLLQIGGSLDAYYRLNLTGGDYDEAPGTSFANLPGFSLGMANLTFARDGEKVGFKADLVFGPRGEDATFNSPILRPGGNSSIVNQLYMYWNITDKIKATFGDFNTFVGYEVISPVSNFHYSTSYLFSYGPFSHTGLKMDVAMTEELSLMAGVFNPTDATEYNPTNDYLGGVQLGYAVDKGSVFLNGLFGEDFYQLDITTGFDVAEKLYLGLNASTASDNFFGAVLYVQSQVSEDLRLGARAEYFEDKGLGLIGDGDHIFDLTLSANYKIKKLTIIPELRLDKVSQDVFVDGSDLTSSLTSFVLAMVYEL
jgi:Putative beta-barrel porin-2, OmpL-like. bbp2